MTERLLGPLRRRGRILLTLLILAITAFHVGRMLRTELAVTGGGLSLPLDDSFIYLQYARAIAQGHPFVYTPGNAPTTGATSLGYPLLLLPPHLLGLSPSVAIAWALALGVVGFVASALLTLRLGHRLGGCVGGGLALALFLASAHLLWGYMSGMEIPLYATVLLATLHTYLRERREARFPKLRWWLLALALARPEGAILCFVFGMLILADRHRAARSGASLRLAEPISILPFLFGALPFLVNLAVAGSIESTSSQAKSILAEPYPAVRATYIENAPKVWSDIAASYAGAFLLDGRGLPFARMTIPFAIGAGLYVAFALWPRQRSWDGGLALLYLVATGILVDSIPVIWQVHLFRYQQGLYPVVILLVTAGFGRLATWGWNRLPRAAGALVAAVAVLTPVVAWSPLLLRADAEIALFYAHNCENILHQQVRVGEWIDQNLPPNAIIGLNDAGAIAYYGKRSTVDLVGLTTAGFARVYRSGLGCLFEHLRRLPADRLPTYFAIYPGWFPYWEESGILGPEAFRAHLGMNTITGGSDMVVYPASWIDVKPTDEPVLRHPEIDGKHLVDSIDLGWLEDEARHEWKAEPEATDVLRRYAYADVRNRPLTDAGRIVGKSERFRASVKPGRDLTLVMRTDAWYPSRLEVQVDGAPAGMWAIAMSESAWVEPTFAIPARLLQRPRPEIRITRVETT
ncbi:MAG TPA: hypothetical protein VJX91_05640, partial [Candidatus Eisenbacteria bacterium]|nr:hypothetical protein [Candidatus Eisenbacteria bacterium]